MHKFQISDAVAKVSSSIKLDGDLVSAIIAVESSYNPYSVRFEPNYKWLNEPQDFAARNGLTIETETQCQKMSWGSMQIMGATARDCGFQGILTELCDVHKGIYYACLYLKKLVDKYSEIKDVISAYNAGHPAKLLDGKYKNQQYVDKVFAKYRGLQSIKGGMGNG